LALPLAQAIDIAKQVAEGLVYAHEHQVVHRDIKPANIMIVRDGVVKILDFGIARMRFSKTFTHTGTVVGSPRYMSPEQVLGKRTGPQSDIFSLGAVLYEMITGRPPFSGSDVNALMFQILNVVPSVPSALNPAVPEILNLVVSKAIAKSPEDRYASAAELAADLRACQSDIDASPREAVHSAESAPAHAKIDYEYGASLSGEHLPGTRREGREYEPTEPSLTLGLANSFDSLEATMRLATRTGMTQEIEEYARTHKVQRTELMEDSAMTRTEERPGTRAQSKWGRRERAIFGASVGAALVIALGLALF
jgi:serine/threonine protein kinase